MDSCESGNAPGEGQVLLREGLFTLSSDNNEKPGLIAGKCVQCGDVSFPSKERCGKCSSSSVDRILLSGKGKIYTYTIVRQAFPGYKLPNIVAMVKVPEDDTLLIISQIRECGVEEVVIGMEVEMIVDELYTALNGRKVIGYAFKPIKRRQ